MDDIICWIYYLEDKSPRFLKFELIDIKEVCVIHILGCCAACNENILQ